MIVFWGDDWRRGVGRSPPGKDEGDRKLSELPLNGVLAIGLNVV